MSPLMEPKRVINIITRLNVGGPSRYVAWLAAELLRAGCDSILVSGAISANEDDMSYLTTAGGIDPIIIEEMGRKVSLKDLVVIWKLYRLFVLFKPDVVNTHTAKAGTVGRLAGVLYRAVNFASLRGHQHRCLFVHTYHGHVLRRYFGPVKTRLFLTIEKLLARIATNRIVVISPGQYRELHNELHIGRSSQYAVIPIGIDTNIFSYQTDDRTRVRRRLGLEDDVVLIGIIGRLTKIKNHSLLLEAISLSSKNLKGTSKARLQLLVFGDGELRTTLEDQVKVLGIEQDVTFLGTLRHLERFYPALDIIASSSLNEGTPLAVIEGMSSSRPIIATDVGGTAELLGKVIESERVSQCDICERGVLVRLPEAEAFGRGLLELARDEGLRARMGVRGRAFVERNHSMERYQDVVQLYFNEVKIDDSMSWKDSHLAHKEVA